MLIFLFDYLSRSSVCDISRIVSLRHLPNTLCLALGRHNGIGQYWGGTNRHSRISAGCGAKIFVGTIDYSIVLFQLWINKGQGHNLLLSGGEILKVVAEQNCQITINYGTRAVSHNWLTPAIRGALLELTHF